MDNLTHSLAGALLGQTGLKRKTGLGMPALIIGANLPDVDAACFAWVDGVEHLAFRRGITHGPPALVLLPLLLAGALWGWDRWQQSRGKRPEGRLPVRFGWLFALAFIGCLTHPALDWTNTYGIRLLEPFSHHWFHGDIIFIVDVWLWLGMGLGVWLSLRREKRGQDWRRTARIAIAGVLAYIGVNAAITWRAENGALAADMPPEFAIASPVPVAFWQRQMITGGDGHWRIDAKIVGARDLSDADKQAIIAQVPAAAPLLFWSRAPFVGLADDGRCILGDARFADSLAGGDRFTVELPIALCGGRAAPR